MTEIVLAFGPLATEDHVARVQQCFPDARVHALPFDVDHGLRAQLSSDPFDPALRAQLPEPSPELRSALATADVLFALDGPADLAALAPRLRLIQAIGSGVRQWLACDLDASRTTLCNSAGLSAPAISEWVLGQLLRVLKQTDLVSEQQRAHRWQPVFGDQLAGRRMAVVGLGEIGKAVATRAAAFGVEVHGIRRTPGTPPAGVATLTHPDHLLDVISGCDLVIGCLPGSTETDDIFDAEAFAAMPNGAIFVNVGRGSSVDEDALMAALRSGNLRAACLDVTRQEPLPSDSELWDCPNLHLSPHSSSSPMALLDGVFARLLTNIEALRQGAAFEHPVDLTSL